MYGVYWSVPDLTDCPNKTRRKIKMQDGTFTYTDRIYQCVQRSCRFLECRRSARRVAYDALRCKFVDNEDNYYIRMNVKDDTNIIKSCQEFRKLFKKFTRWCNLHKSKFRAKLYPEKTKKSKVHWQGIIWFNDKTTKETFIRYCQLFYLWKPNSWSLTPINDSKRQYRDLVWASLYTLKHMRQRLTLIVAVKRKRLILNYGGNYEYL